MVMTYNPYCLDHNGYDLQLVSPIALITMVMTYNPYRLDHNGYDLQLVSPTALITVVMTLWLVLVAKLTDELVEEATRGRKHHGLYFHPEPPIDPRTSLGHVEDN